MTLPRDDRNKFARLSMHEVQAICLALCPIGEMVPNFADKLAAQGLRAFIPFFRFPEIFASDQQQVDVHRRCVVEEAKTRLSRPWPFRIGLRNESFYKSEFLAQLAEIRDKENGVPLKEVSSRYPGQIWRLELDPCQRAMALARVQEPSSYLTAELAARSETNTIRQREVALVAAHAPRRDAYVPEEIYADCLRGDEFNLGLHLDESRSSGNWPVFTKRTTATWDICIVLENVEGFFASGVLELLIELRHRDLCGPRRNDDQGLCMIVDYQRLLPGFLQAYRSFANADELRLDIRAHACLCSLLLPAMERAIQGVLEP